MKKIISLLTIMISSFFFINYTNGATVNVYAVVGNVNTAPKVTFVNPSSNPVLIRKTKSQSFSVGMVDSENENIYYTISADSGTVSVLTGLVVGSGSINFIYLATAVGGNTKVYVTLNDGINFVVKQINIYVY